MSTVSFIIKKSSNKHFLTVQTGKNRIKKNIETGRVHVIKKDKERDFKVMAVHGDNEFGHIYVKKSMQPAIVHIKGREEHDGIIERSVRTLKKLGRSTCHYVPYRKYTKLTMNYLVEGEICWLNAFPSNNGVSSTFGTVGIFLGWPQLYSHIKGIAFGANATSSSKTKS